MTVRTALDQIDDAVKDVFDLASRRQVKEREGSRRNVYEKSLRNVKQIAGDEEMVELREWIIQYIRENEKFPSGRETRKQGARICRDSGHTVPTGSWLGAD
jgi:hypothetical protein